MRNIAMLVNQRITGVTPHKLDRNIQFIFAPNAITSGGHFGTMINSVSPGENGNLRFHRVIEHRKPLHAKIP